MDISSLPEVANHVTTACNEVSAVLGLLGIPIPVAIGTVLAWLGGTHLVSAASIVTKVTPQVVQNKTLLSILKGIEKVALNNVPVKLDETTKK